MAALIPLEELLEPQVRQRYDMPEDAEVYDMLTALARQKEVWRLSFDFDPWLPYYCTSSSAGGGGSGVMLFFSLRSMMDMIISCAWW